MDASLAKLCIGKSDPFGDYGCVAAGDFQHVVGHIDADDAALRADHLRGDETDLPRAGAQVEHGLTGLEPLGGIAAAVVLFDDFVGDGFKPLAVVFDRAAESGFLGAGGGSVAVFDFGSDGGF